VVILEHNGYAYSTPTSQQTAVARLALKAKAYGIPAETVDGNDVFAVYHATEQAVTRARAGGGTSMIEVVTYRRRGHAEHDDQRYQPREEIEHWERNDPIERYVTSVTSSGWLAPGDLAAADQRVAAELDAAVAACEDDPLPQPDSALNDVFAHPPQAERLWFRRLDA
jgi:pyruvate dehydrogenase E1 component alpha subunit/2-oxoisovalerate dehydrogenase E1 component alpha subunit